jgi:hypothetical protein
VPAAPAPSPPMPAAPPEPALLAPPPAGAPPGALPPAFDPPPPGPLPAPGHGGHGHGGSSPAGVGGGFPAHLQALMDSVERTPASSTARLMRAVALLEEGGISQDDAVARVFGRFPVGGLATYTHDWWFPRSGPGWRLHQGTDIFAERGTPVRAPAAGVVSIGNGGLGGLSVRVTEPDGTYWYMAHLHSVAPGLTVGDDVAVGQVVGTVGDSGNARGGLPHLHIELHPDGGAAVDPKAVLDGFLAEAEAKLDPDWGVTETDLDDAEEPQSFGPVHDLFLTDVGAEPVDRYGFPMDSAARTIANPFASRAVEPWQQSRLSGGLDPALLIALAALLAAAGQRRRRFLPG